MNADPADIQTPVQQRIEQLRQALSANALDALIIESSDPHLSEYLPAHWQGRQWASGFTGSAGTLVITATFAGLWTDSRYWVQAQAELAGSGISLMKADGQAHNTYSAWLSEHLPAGARVSVDAQTLSISKARSLRSALEAKGIGLTTAPDILSAVWTDRPALPAHIVYAHLKAPVSRTEKLNKLREHMRAQDASWHLVSTLDDICWITNLRGADVPYNPVFLAHLLIGPESATVFVDENKVPLLLRMKLQAEGFALQPYADIGPHLARFENTRFLLDPKRISEGLRQCINANVQIIEAINPSTVMKARKTAEELEQIRATMVLDGVAMVQFLCWLDNTLERNNTHITELTIDEHLSACRAQQAGYVSASFPTIAGYNANGAMPHYRATARAHATIEGDGLLLIDSGGQYTTGTTDITRVVPVGTPSQAQKQDFTVVLKGMIALSAQRFPRGTPSPHLDSIARAPIWQAGADYGHGTGHGVGYFLNVHEGPHGIAASLPAEAHTALEPGMITSNEPGIYRPGQWGVRIENLIVTAADTTTELGEFLKFETLTLCPIDTRLIDHSLMRTDELAWLNAYHSQVWQHLSPHLTKEEKAWLRARTEALEPAAVKVKAKAKAKAKPKTAPRKTRANAKPKKTSRPSAKAPTDKPSLKKKPAKAAKASRTPAKKTKTAKRT